MALRVASVTAPASTSVGQPLAVARDRVVVVLAQLLADGVHLLAEQELALAVLEPSVTSLRIFSDSSCSARASLTQPRTSVSRSLRSRVSSSSTLRSTPRSGHQPTRSARAEGSSTPRSTSVRRRPPRASNRARSAARSSVALVGDRVGDLVVGDRRGVDPQPAGLADDAEAHLGARGGADDQRRRCRRAGCPGSRCGRWCPPGRSGRRPGGGRAAGCRPPWRPRRPPPRPRRSRGRGSPPCPAAPRRW